jgi:BirA family biotin operon repressor/biotin-[acetyl-CoA-carboxylase] ligase
MMKVIELDECGSTNDEAWKSAPGPALVTARRQTGGRGRQGRRWEQGAEGNVAVSLVIPAPERNLSWLPLAAGVAAYDALEQALELTGARVDLSVLRLKWPNDIMWGEAKLGGILCESRMLGERAVAVVAGLGLNLVRAPSVEGMRTASVLENLLAIDASKLTPARLEAMRLFFVRQWADDLLDWAGRLGSGDSEALRAAWKARAKLDRFGELTVHRQNGAIEKLIAVDLDPSGRLQGLVGGETIYLDTAQ